MSIWCAACRAVANQGEGGGSFAAESVEAVAKAPVSGAR